MGVTVKKDFFSNKRPARLCIMTTVPITVVFFYGEQIDFLKERGFDITLITSPDGLMDKRISKSCRLVLIPMVRGISLFRDLVSLWKIFLEIQKGRFDMIQYCTPKAALLGSISAFILRVPIRLYLLWGLYYTGQKGLIRILMRSVEKIICALSTDVAPNGENYRDFIIEEKLCPVGKISIAGSGASNGIDLDRFNPERLKSAGLEIRKKYGIPEKATVLGFVGRIRGDKGIHELAAAFKQLRVKYPDIWLLLVGPWEAELSEIGGEERDFIRCHGDQIIYVGYQEKVEEFMAAMDIFTLPSYREGFGVVNVEASAMGLPVVSTFIDGVKDSVLVDKTGFLVPAKSVEGLAGKIGMLINDEKLRKEMGRAGVEWAKKFERHDRWESIFQHRSRLLCKTGYISYDGRENRLFAEEKSRGGGAKRILDIILALVLIVPLSIPMLVIAALIKFVSRGPVIFWTDRVGKDNSIFKMAKFRTMKLDTPQMATHLMKNPRDYLIPGGEFLRRYSLDELPQLFNVLKGDMSFVGPRPALFNQDDLVKLRTSKNIHTLTPGVTGWAQVNGRDDLPISTKVLFDEYYLNHRSFVLDLYILLLTAVKVIRREGVSH